MKIINVNCPNCNAGLDFDLDDIKTFCPYCGQKLMIDYEKMKPLMLIRVINIWPFMMVQQLLAVDHILYLAPLLSELPEN